MQRTITAALLLSFSLALTPAAHASALTSHSPAPPRSSLATLSGVCSALLFLRVRRPRGPKQ